MSDRLVLVTGGAGFIGSNIVAELSADASLDVAVCDWLGPSQLGKWRNLAKHAVADFVAPEELSGWLETRGRGVEAIIHMGAISSTIEPDADKIVATNFRLSRDLFDWCARHGRRFIYASSAATYGDGAGGFDDDPSPESLAALRPLNAYGWSKALFDVYAARQAGRGHGPPQWTGLKFFNVYGPNEDHKGQMRSVVAKIWPEVAAGRAVELFRSYRDDCADGGQRRDFVYVRDAAEIVAWLFHRGDVSGIFNVGSGKARSFHDLACGVFEAVQIAPRIEFIDMPPELRNQYQYFTQAKMERLTAAGYSKAATSLEDGIADYVNGFLAGPDRYR